MAIDSSSCAVGLSVRLLALALISFEAEVMARTIPGSAGSGAGAPVLRSRGDGVEESGALPGEEVVVMAAGHGDEARMGEGRGDVATHLPGDHLVLAAV